MKKASPTYNLATEFPEIAAQWHPILNNNVIPEQVLPKSDKKPYWLCEYGHIWQASVGNRTGPNKTGCPNCNSNIPTENYNFGKFYPELISQWHSTLNVNLSPFQFTPYSDQEIWWICDHKHIWKTKIKKRSQGSNCPFCCRTPKSSEKYNLLFCFPEIASQWDYESNYPIRPENICPHAKHKFVWKCEYNHKWISAVFHRTAKNKSNNCPKCFAISISGPRHPNWKGGITKQGYPSAFKNPSFKEKIRLRDNYTCQGCNINEQMHVILYDQRLHIHHIDHNRLNLDFNNLITLCRKCNTKANYNIDYWIEFYQTKIQSMDFQHKLP
jgi:hypothetical protein